MKTLADLKRNAANYKWSLIVNSWFGEVPEFQQVFRKVGRVRTSDFSLLTNKDGVVKESWINWPKAKELTITQLETGNYHVEMKFDCGSDRPVHVMAYQLNPISEG